MSQSAPIAIIGVGLRLPQADRLDLFWRHLAAGRSLIRKLPSERWDVEENGGKAGESRGVWGGFLDDAQGFDAAFFGISPKEASWMDPQQRFALEMAWHAIEDAGLQASALAGSRTGVYMGVCHWDYAELLEKHLAHVDAYLPTGTAFSIIANRVSHFFDFHGPSITNDTACAASMTSVYEAVRALQSGECDLALAGGANLIWSPNHFDAFSKAGMLSKTGRSQAFDEGADGYVRGEGGAVLLLKPLANALADGDHIQAVIRGIGINHGGRTNSLTVTNPSAQSDLIQSVYRAAEVLPGSIDFIEAHGPGTPLGDPIEIAGLKQAFAMLHEDAGTQPQPGSCGIGSVKTNIGHLEGAAGVAGIVKVLAALRYETWPANVGFKTLNTLIDFDGSPFYIQKEAASWPKGGKPRRAGVSSFGFGGSNGHILLEGFEDAGRDDAAPSVGPVVVPLSARNEERLLAYAAAVLDFVEGDGLVSGRLSDLAYTYQTGREDMDVRIAFVVKDTEDLIRNLKAFLQGQKHTSDGKNTPAVWAARWMAGEAVDWSEMDRGQDVRRMSVPPYPFARDIHWMDLSWDVKDARPFPHPLLHRNISGFEKLAFQTKLTGAEFVWADHHVGEDQVLPGMACLEMVRAAVALADGDLEFAAQGLCFEDVVWVRPVRAQPSGSTLTTNISRVHDGRVTFTIERLDQDGSATTIVQGSLRQGDVKKPERLALDTLRDALPQKIEVADCYARLRASGVHHGPTFQVLKSVQRGDGQVLAGLKLPRRLQPTLDIMALHPIMLDGAIQAWIALETGEAKGAAVPFACDRVEVFGPCETAMWATVRPTAGAQNSEAIQHLDIELCDREGNVRAAFHNLVMRVMANQELPASTESVNAKEPEPFPLVLAEGTWEQRVLDPLAATPVPTQVSVLAGGLDQALAQDLAERLPGPMLRLPDLNGDDGGTEVEAWFAFVHRHIADGLKERSAGSRKLLVVVGQSLPAYLTEPLAALLRTAALENPTISGAVLIVADDVDVEDCARLIEMEVRSGERFCQIRYDKDLRRSVWQPRQVSLPAVVDGMPIDSDGVYWISGGVGGLGLHFVDWLISHGAHHIILSGRRKVLDGGQKEIIKALAVSGVAIHYRACDVADAAEVVESAAWIAQEVGPLKGIIHAAGILEDGFILTQSEQDIAKVFAPKVAGAFNLDAATADLDLAFLVLCSSIAVPFGNVGQAAYGGANAFLDAFAEHRSLRVENGDRHGRTVSIGWPLWADGGMRVDASTLAAMERRWGTTPLPTAAGLAALEQILRTGSQARYTVLHGHIERIDDLLATYGAGVVPVVPRPVSSNKKVGDDKGLHKGAVNYLREVLADVLHIEPDGIRANRKLDEYGLDSISIVETTNRLEEVFGPLSKTLFFEYVDLNGIAGHLLETHRDILAGMLALEAADFSTASAAQDTVIAKAASTAKVTELPDKQDNHDVAVVGLSMRVAKAADQEAFWNMLAEGIDGFEPYPQSRWDHAAMLHPERDVLGKTVVRTGAFLADMDKFDPRYFRISQAEAELMSPEVRLFLQASVEAFEDAGYSREQMHHRYGGDVAVIVGSMTNEYHLYGFQNMLVRGSKASGSYTGTVPNMVSYYYGFTGPSYFLDTMCSASSTCVHEAVHMLRAGRCKMALAGGVSLLLHPQKLIATSQEHFTTKTADVIRGYGVGADGTILGEGVGALVLKTLADAERDGDHIYGVIKGSGISNAGVRNGFTVPNPNQQAVAIEGALEDAGIEASSIGYVEGHGSGTALGDPIEVKALTRVYGDAGVAFQSCPLGTVKSNVAHLLGASGLAGMVKVLMQLKHGELVPSLHAETLNPDIPFEKTPFYVQRTRTPWARKRDQAGLELPRRAGVTSIGAGGMNSHIIFEEYQDNTARSLPTGAELLVFSAMNERALLTVVERFHRFLMKNSDAGLADVAHTLQVGKNELPCRLALVVPDMATALSQLSSFSPPSEAQDDYYYIQSILDQDPPDDDDALCDAIAGRDLEAVGKAWVEGASIDWGLFHHGRDVRRVSLPAYPFERVRCWYHDEEDVPSVINPLGSKLKLHPFIGRNHSDLSGLKYTTKIHMKEMQDYLFTKDREAALLPIAPVEIAVALARIAGLSGTIALRDLVVEGAVEWPQVRELSSRVERLSNGELRVLLETLGEDANPRPWATAILSRETEPNGALVSSSLDLATMRSGSTELLDHAAFYRRLSDQGYGFGPYLETVDQSCRLADGGLLCSLRKNSPQQDGFKRNLQVSAPALAAAYQLLELADPGWLDDVQWSLKDAIFITGKEAGEIAHVRLMAQGKGRFELSFLTADGILISAWRGMGRQPLTAAQPLAFPAKPTLAIHDAVRETVQPDSEITLALRRVAGDILKFSAEDIGLRDPFHDLGFDSVSLTRYAHDLGTLFNIELSPALFFECEHVQALADHLVAHHGVSLQSTAEQTAPPVSAPAVMQKKPEATSGDAVAIIGMAGRFPGSANIEDFFDHLLAGDDLIGDLPLARYSGDDLSRIARAGFVKRGGFLRDVDKFDAAFFKISPVEAERMDPQQRILLETVWHALDHAGYTPQELPEQTGVFVGVSRLDYADLLRAHGVPRDGYTATGNSLAMVANRISHALDIHGPSQSVDTACSSSLIALLQAVHAIQSGRCDSALVGGVNLCLSLEGFEGPHDAGMLSPTGRCQSFGRDGDGYVRGEGVVALLVKRLADAQRDGDRILGVVLGGAENHGGRSGSLTAPNAKAQAQLVRRAMAGIDPHSMSYIEAHGTGTSLGDPVEVNGLKLAYADLMGSRRAEIPFIGLGSVKSNIGHLEAAAGLAGVVKVLIAMQRELLPPTLHCQDVNPYVDLRETPFRLVREREHWPHREDVNGTGLPRRAAVSSFGFGGVNAHIILEEAPSLSHPQRHAKAMTDFAPTRFWVPAFKSDDEGVVTLTPNWVRTPLKAGHIQSFDQRIVVPCERSVSSGQGARIYDVKTGGGDIGVRYGVMAAHLLSLLQDLLCGLDHDKVLIQLVVPQGDERELFAGLAAMLETAHIETPRISGQLIEVPDSLDSDAVASLLAAEATVMHKRVRYFMGQREVCTWIAAPSMVQDHKVRAGVTLITGGMGGLGRHVARDIADHENGAVLVLVGASALDHERSAFLEELRRMGAVAQYQQVDIADDDAVTTLVQGIAHRHGVLNTVIHCAGCLRDGYIHNKNVVDLAAVLRPKVMGALALRKACQGMQLDAFVMFSSLTGVVGNGAQVDYAAANGFLDALAESDSENLISINWPLWRQGGMQVDTATEERLYRQMGQRPLETPQGLAVLSHALGAGLNRVAAVAGERTRIMDFFARRYAVDLLDVSVNEDTVSGDLPMEDSLLRTQTTAALGNLFARVGGFDAESIAAQKPLDEYGIDSLMITRLNAALDTVFGPLPKTLFFQYRTLNEVVDYLLCEQERRCRRWVGLDDASSPPKSQPQVTNQTTMTTHKTAEVEPIAVIGISGHYPGGDDLDGLWNTLISGQDVVSEIPQERWSLQGFYHADPDEAVERGMSYAKWGAFLDGFADFDPLFFKIAPRDAAAMDPQERLFLMSAWAAFEDAGYSPKRLKATTGGHVGVFAGVTKTGFALHGPFASEEGAIVRPITSFASVANRVSHALDLSGPSIPVDTMCSSSLTAIHEACAYLRSTRGTMALAGGVNLYLHPSNYIDLCASKMLSPDGRCKSFGADANGFVPGEGVGCVVLKPLSRALVDGDHIHALICGSAVNHGGRNNGYTVPNPAAQRDVVRAAMKQAGVKASEIDYIEAHGTGTELGDPIEVEGLRQAFQVDTDKREFCALGSVKSVLGHLEAAAGIAGLSKVILQMKHATLVPTRHVAQTNPNIDFPSTPFTVQSAVSPWPASKPRIAGVSSFGAGGANAHLIVSAWPDHEESASPAKRDAVTAPLQAITLSARDPERLRLQAERLLAYLQGQNNDVCCPLSVHDLATKLAEMLAVLVVDIDMEETFDALGMEPHHWQALKRWLAEEHQVVLEDDGMDSPAQLLAGLSPAQGSLSTVKIEDVAHTLQVGREAMACRLGLVVDSIDALIDGLRNWLSGNTEPSGIYVGQDQNQSGAVTDLIGDEVLEEVVARHGQKGHLDKVLKLWVGGVTVDWDTLPRAVAAKTIALPTYPFARHRYWFPLLERKQFNVGLVEKIGKAQGDAVLLGAGQRLERHVAMVLKAILSNGSDTAVISGFERWHKAALTVLAPFAKDPPHSLEEAWSDWQAYSHQSSENSAQRKLAEMALRALPDILAGREKAIDVLFPGGSLEAVEAVYKDNPTAVRFSRSLAVSAAAFVGERSRQVSAQGLRILEIGAGTGGTSEAVFEALSPYAESVSEYCYSDVSKAFLIHARRNYERVMPQLTTALFDVEKPLAKQGIEPGGYDLVIAANVLHATADIGNTLATVRETLAPGGLLLINETSMATLFTHVTFGLLDGWWRFTDANRRIAGTPSLTADHWRQAMEEAGLTWVVGSSAAEMALGQQILAAQAPGRKAHQAQVQALNIHDDVATFKGPEIRSGHHLRDVLLDALAQTLNIAPSRIGIDQAFADLGLDSILGADWVRRLRRVLGIELDQTRLFDFTNVVQLESYLFETYPESLESLMQTPEHAEFVEDKATVKVREPIAIVGMSGRFAGSNTIDDLWDHLVAGDDLVKPVSRFDLSPYYSDAEPGSYGHHGSFIENIECFDPDFFGISGVEATYMDPQQRLFLEEAWKTLEHAGHGGEDMIGRHCGVFVGCSHGDYQTLFKGDPPGQAFWGNTTSLIPARISYWLNLKGPAVAIDTACSSSLVAIHQACQSLWSGESEMALVGGVFVQSSPRFFRSANQAQMLSPSGRCAAFGEGADGIVPGEAVAAVLLRPLSQALADGDTIHGVIVGSATNQDGATNGITAPSGLSQEKLIRRVHKDFAIDPASIGMIEAHGTGTPLGDPIEYAALSRIFQTDGKASPRCFLGSIKSNIGHATTAAGISGLMRVLLSLKHAQVPPTLHVDNANPAIAYDQGPFILNREVMPWRAGEGAPRRAGINAFGFGGTNAHLVVEEAPAQPKNRHRVPAYLFVLSARTADQLRQQAQRMLDHLDRNPEQADEDIAFTLMEGRRHLHYRLRIVADGADAFAQRLREWLAGRTVAGVDQGEVDLRDLREDAQQYARGLAQIEALAELDVPDKMDLSARLEELAAFYLQGYRLPFRKVFSARCRRVPLPAYPLAGKRYWVEDAPQESRDQGVPLMLSDPAQPDDVFTAVPIATKPCISLAPLGTDTPIHEAVSGLQSETHDGVRVLRLEGSFGLQNAQALHRALSVAEQDASVGAVLILGGREWRGGAEISFAAELINSPLTCALPVVSVLMTSASGPGVALALSSDFVVLADDATVDCCDVGAGEQSLYRRRLGSLAGQTICAATLQSGASGMRIVAAGQVEEVAQELAGQLAQAPREAAMVLKQHMRHDLPTFELGEGGMQTALHTLAQADTPKPFVGGAQPIALKTQVMNLDLFEDGVMVLQLNEQAGSNTFTNAFMDGMEEAFAIIAQTPQAKAVVMTGYDGYFSCGGTADGLKKLQAGATRFTDRKIYSLPLDCDLPVIAAMQGHAIGAGWSLGMFCDVALFAAEGVYHSNYMWYGFTPGAGATLVFPFRLGDDLGREVLFSAREYRGVDLVGRAPGLTVLPAADILVRAMEMAHVLATHPRQKLVTMKAETTKPLVSYIDQVLAQELAMHEKTFVGNAQVRSRIEEKFFAAEPQKPASTDSHDVQTNKKPQARTEVRERVVTALAEDLMIDVAEIRDDAAFLDLGLDSILAVTWIRRLNELFAVDLAATAVYAHPTVGSMVAHMTTLMPAQEKPQIEPQPSLMPVGVPGLPVVEQEHTEAVAIIGASGCFPKSGDLTAFWDNIRSGQDCIEEVPSDRWDVGQFYHPDPQNPGTSYCKWMGWIDDVDRFDPAFFNITPREAELMDPQQRLFLEHAWHAIEDAACDPLALAGKRCGVYAASGPSGYADLIQERNAYSLSGNSGSILAARISYFLDLRGPCLSIDTACSSSLVAIAEACDNLVAKRCDMALAGGVSVLIGPDMFIDSSKVSMLSKEGRCFTFDQRADGFVPGEGIGVVVLKRLQDAERDGDPIRGVIRGWGVNQDGRTNGITAPNPQAQTNLMREIHQRFDIDPASIDLVECHGTGTPLGDPIEVEGLTNAFGEKARREQLCAIGSVKSNIGHVLAAAGVAGALKALLALEQRQLPPSLHFENCNRHIALDKTPFFVNTSLQAWPQPQGRARRAAVSSFGFSGTNAHLILEEAIATPAPCSSPGPWVFTLSAKSAERLQAYAVQMKEYVRSHADLDLASLAYTLQVGRSDFPHRLAFVYADRGELVRILASVTSGQTALECFMFGPNSEQTSLFEADDDVAVLIDKWLISGRLDKLAKLAEIWSRGARVDWSNAPVARRIRMPGYPFAEERFWVTQSMNTETTISDSAIPAHTSNDEPPLAPEKQRGLVARIPVSSQHHLPGLFMPEMARDALEQLQGRPVRGLKHLLWGAPVRLDQNDQDLDILISSDEKGYLYRVAAEGAEETPYHLAEQIGEHEAIFRPDDLVPDHFLSHRDVSADFMNFWQHSGLANSSVRVRGVYRDEEVLTARLERLSDPDGSAQESIFDVQYLTMVGVLAAFRQSGDLQNGDKGEGALLPSAMGSMVSYGLLKDAAWLRIWNRPDGSGSKPMTAVFYGDDGKVCLALNDLYLASEGQSQTLELNG